MDEISALRYIFKGSMRERDRITISFNNNTYEITPEVVEAESYRNVYNYILNKEMSCSPPKPERTPEVQSNYVDIPRITEEQFMDWAKSSRKLREKRDSGQSGKSIWKAKHGDDNMFDV